MRSSSTFSEEIEAISDMLYSEAERDEFIRIRQPFGSLKPRVVSGVENAQSKLLNETDEEFSGDWHFQIPDTDHVFAEFSVQAIVDATKGSIEELISSELGIDIPKLYRSSVGDSTTVNRVASAVARFGTEAFATYLPWHSFANSPVTPWGMYFFLEPLLEWATVLQRSGRVHRVKLSNADALRLAFFVAYRHELFHFHVEWFCVRQEVLQCTPIYRPYDEEVFRKLAGTKEWTEEALAQAVVLESTFVANKLRIPKHSYRALLEAQFDEFGPGYNNLSRGALKSATDGRVKTSQCAVVTITVISSRRRVGKSFCDDSAGAFIGVSRWARLAGFEFRHEWRPRFEL